MHPFLREMEKLLDQEHEILVRETEIMQKAPLDELIKKGDCIPNIRLERRESFSHHFSFEDNLSKIRRGDYISLESSSRNLKGLVTAIGENWMDVIINSRGTIKPNQEWNAKIFPLDFTSLVKRSLSKLSPGYPGWGLIPFLLGNEPIPSVSGFLQADFQRNSKIFDTLLAHMHNWINQEQIESIQKCLSASYFYGVLGPPGTGKTRCLAVFAETLSRAGYRVLVTAPTHQAVNNALNTIKKVFPERALEKIGDDLMTESLEDGIPNFRYEKGHRKRKGLSDSEVIVGMTFATALSHLVVQRNLLSPEIILVDEAGQLPLSHGITLGLIGGGSIHLFGDDRQMPPVFNAEIVESPLATSVFSRLNERHPDLVFKLSTTYRLNKELCKVIGETFYPDERGGTFLKIPQDFSARKTCDALTMMEKRMGTKASLCWISHGFSDHSDENPQEKDAAVQLFSLLIRDGLSPNDIALVTPFRRQSALIRRELKEAIPHLDPFPIIDTVERVQGITVKVIIYSACASEWKYLNSIKKFFFSPNRLNVALSRATQKVFILASTFLYDGSFGNGNAHDSGVFRKILDQAKEIPLPDFKKNVCSTAE